MVAAVSRFNRSGNTAELSLRDHVDEEGGQGGEFGGRIFEKACLER